MENNGTEKIGLVTPTPGDKPLPEPMMTKYTDTYMQH